MKTMKNKITPMDVAKAIGVENEYLNVLIEQELKDSHIMTESEKVKHDFLNEDFVDLPK